MGYPIEPDPNIPRLRNDFPNAIHRARPDLENAGRYRNAVPNPPRIPNPDDDDYVVIPPLDKDPWKMPKGARCGLCGVTIEFGKPYWISCAKQNCPMFFRAVTLHR